MKKLAIAGLGMILSAGFAGGVLAADQPAQKSVTGTLEDSYCYGSMGAKGASHKKCAIECVKKGIPVSLVDSDGNIYVLLPPKMTKLCPTKSTRRWKTRSPSPARNTARAE